MSIARAGPRAHRVRRGHRPFAARDWQRGRIHDENSEAEEAYVRAVLDISAKEGIDTVFPSWDPEVGILSKNKSRFTARGVTVPVPEWPVLAAAG